MRLVTWNCRRIEIPGAIERLQPLAADLIVLQECRPPAGEHERLAWRGTPEGLGVAVACNNPSLRLERLEVPPDVPATVLPVIVHGPEPFVLIDLWALPKPTYEAFTLSALSACAIGASLPVVLAGDLNSTPVVESQRRTSRAMVRRLQDEFGLVSAYHARLGVGHGLEPHATFFERGQENRPFHIDYCFVPEAWAQRIVSVEVGSYAEWPDSDHRPLIVDLSG